MARAATITWLVGAVHHRLAVVRLLDVPPSRSGHDAGVGVGEVALRHVLGDPRMTPAIGLSLLSSLPGQGLQRRIGFPYLSQPALPEGPFLRQFISPLVLAVPAVLLIVHFLGSPEQLGHLSRQLPFLLFHPAVAHRLIPGGVGLNLGAVQRHVAQPHQSSPLAQFQHVPEQVGKRCQVVLAKVGDGAKVGGIVGRQDPERDVLVETLGDAACGGHAGAIAVEQHLDHHPRMVGRVATLLALIAAGDGRQVQLVHQVGDEVGRMVRWQPLLERGRQQQLLLGLVGTEGLAHQRLRALDARPIIPALTRQRCFSDGLLGLGHQPPCQPHHGIPVPGAGVERDRATVVGHLDTNRFAAGMETSLPRRCGGVPI